MNETRTMLTVQEVAEMKGVGTRTVRGWIERGIIKAEQLNPRMWLINKDAIDTLKLPTSGRPSKKQSS